MPSLSCLCRLPEDRGTWEPVVRRVYASETDAALRADILEWLDEPTEI
jgi:hypothetical protein